MEQINGRVAILAYAAREVRLRSDEICARNPL